jgi:hypothetical protein
MFTGVLKQLRSHLPRLNRVFIGNFGFQPGLSDVLRTRAANKIFCKIPQGQRYRHEKGEMMKMFLAHIGPLTHLRGMWGVIALALLILFVVLVVTEGSETKDK